MIDIMWCDLYGNQSEVEHVTFQFSIWLKCPFGARYIILLKTLTESDQWFINYSNWMILKTIENNRNSFLFLDIFYNQCFRLVYNTIISLPFLTFYHKQIGYKLVVKQILHKGIHWESTNFSCNSMHVLCIVLTTWALRAFKRKL